MPSIFIDSKELASRRASLLARKVSFAAALIGAVLAVAFQVIGEIGTLQRSRDAVLSQIRGGLRLGDHYQLQKAVGALVDGGLAAAAIWIPEQISDRPLVAAGAAADIRPPFRPGRSVHFSSSGVLIRQTESVNEGEGSPAAWLILDRIFRPVALIWVILLAAVLWLVSRRVLRRTLGRFASDLLAPLERIPTRLGRSTGSGGAQHLSDASSDPELAITEIELLFREIESHRASELQAKQREFQLKSAQALGTLALQVAHDIRAPLGALKVLEHSATELPADSKELLSSTIRRVSSIAEQLLEQNRKLRADSNTARLDSILAALEEVTAARTGVSIPSRVNIQFMSRESYESSAKYTVALDALQTLFENLLNNAVEASPAPASVRIQWCTTPEHLVVLISDSGAGIPGPVWNRLGMPGATHGKQNGNGLGVSGAAAYLSSIVGASLWAGTRAGAGTTVAVVLPAESTQSDVIEGALRKTMLDLGLPEYSKLRKISNREMGF